MSASPSSSPVPWPRPTQPPSPAVFHYPHALKRRRVFEERQVITDQTAVLTAEQRCNLFSGNEVYSCFPTTDTVIPQGQWASFVWNSRRPEITQTNLVDIFLFRGDSQTQILHYTNVSNPTDQAGLLRAQVNDAWFGSDGLSWSGKNVSYPFYWVIIRSDKTLDGNQVPQPIFTAVQTTMLDSVVSSSVAASSMQASLSSASARSQSLASQSLSNGDGHVQHGLSDSQFPRWAIAVIVVLGFLAITATCLLTFLILRRLRRQRTEASLNNRNSMNSNSPMILNHDAQMKERNDSPLLPPTAALSSAGGAHTFHDGASTDSGGPFSGADAAIMAQAFRTMLRQPDFVGRPVEEGDSPDRIDAEAEEDDMIGGAGSSRHHGSLALSKELTEEGRDIRSVSSSRGVRVESLPAGASTEESR